MRAIAWTLLLTFALLAAGAPLGPAAATGDCVGPACASDERAGDNSTPCEYGTPHDPRYRYLNASAQYSNHRAGTTLTFACESSGFNGEWFYGNTTYSDGGRTDAVRLYYYYGDIYWWDDCRFRVRVDPDQIRGNNLHFDVGYHPNNCPHAEDWPSVVSTLP